MKEFDPTSSFFTAYRTEFGFPYFYREVPLNLFREIGLWGVGVIYIVIVLVITVIIAFLGTRGYSRWRVTLQMIISLSIGCSIIVCVTGNFWREASYEKQDGTDKIGYRLNIGLHQANITMTRTSIEDTVTEFHNLKIGWREVDQAEAEYRDALMVGWPEGILRIARYISVDVGEMRYMRSFRNSGYAVYILLWAAFAAWILANVLMSSHIAYSACFLLFTGALKLLACIVYSAIQPTDFYIPKDDGSKVTLRFSWMYWVTLFVAIFVIVISVIILVLDYLRPADMNKFFGTTSEFVVANDEAELAQNQNKDIKGIIRRLSTKRLGKTDSKKKLQTDLEPSKDTPFSSYHSSNRSPSSPQGSASMYMEENMPRKRGNAVTTPEIHVEMSSIDGDIEMSPIDSRERGRRRLERMSEREYVDKENDLNIDTDSESGSERSCSEKNSASTYPVDTTSMSLDDVTNLHTTSSSMRSSQQKLIVEN
ncbi:hypothetical protein EB796_019778 [Bugula neritina]|uniref:DUOXA1 n=1 Tax=Bugula neritina TaxID=10212 RepID=A0A7J7J7A8_BUGNE|nr:hypothetical protein EB796_019778 [Bugula neritina]